MSRDPGNPEQRRLAFDPDADSASRELPGFLARPEGTPPYHGFPLLEEVEVDGFRLGMVTDFLAETYQAGDAFIEAPDGSRAGLVWEANVDPYFDQVLAPDERRWGVWSVGLPLPLTTLEQARNYLAELVPELRARWEAWRSETAS